MDLPFEERLSDKHEKIISQEIKMFANDGVVWTMQQCQRVADRFMLDPKELYDWGTELYKQMREELKVTQGAIPQIEEFLRQRFAFRRNSITKKVYYRPHDQEIFEPCIYNNIWRLLQHNLRYFGVKKIPITDVQTLLESDFVREFHPIKEYFESLPEWDTQTDYIDLLSSHVKCENQEFWRIQFKKALVRMIACSYANVENRIVMTLYTQSQNIGKNRFIKFLCPPRLLEYFKEDPITEHKDSEIALTQNFIWHMDELESLGKRDLTSLKSFISRSTTKQRMAYARQEETRPRIVNFWASTNKDEFLQDVQNTRWLCFRVTHINWDYHNKETKIFNIDIDNVWSQAWYLFKQGNFQYQLSDTERHEQHSQNKAFETSSVEKQLINKYISPMKPFAVNAEFMMPAEILQYLITKSGVRMNLNSYSIVPAMVQLGFKESHQTVNGNKMKGFWLYKSPVDQPQQLSIHPDATTQSNHEEDVGLPF